MVVSVNLVLWESVKKKNIVSIKNDTAEENALKSIAVENNLGKSDSSRAISRVRTRFIPRSENNDIRPKMERAAE